ncbi:MAG: carbohydrate kinase family protein [Candidatus Bipolaricaulis sp.]|nr:carbohydrate kinase family protein [Candidatus Bipolaricaulis sp.]MDD5219232.1 carbohydrate kinase family protein [Candidatus Bipolaricaulis sp.]
MSRIVVLGDLNLDIGIDETPQMPGDEVRGSVSVAVGGSAGTFARVAARLGDTVVFIGAVGRDIAGDLLERSLQEAGIEAHLRRTTTPSGAVVAIRRGDERSMVCSRGANNDLEAEWIAAQWLEGAAHLHVSGYALLADRQRAAARRAIALATDGGATVSLNPPPANLIESFGAERFDKELAGVRWIFPNEEEGRALSGKTREADVVSVLAHRHEAGAWTLGVGGAIAWRAGAIDRCGVERRLDVNSTGAGDAYAAGFVHAALDGRPLKEVNRAACDAAYRHLRERRA